MYEHLHTKIEELSFMYVKITLKYIHKQQNRLLCMSAFSKSIQR